MPSLCSVCLTLYNWAYDVRSVKVDARARSKHACFLLVDDAKGPLAGDTKPAEQPAQNGDAPSGPAEPELTAEAALAAAQAEAAAVKKRVFRGMAPPATLLQDLSRCAYCDAAW